MANKIDVTDKRQMAGYRLAGMGTVTPTGRNDWTVHSDSGKAYDVIRHISPDNEEMWECDCPDHRHRQMDCKHIHAARVTDMALFRFNQRAELFGKAFADMEVQIAVHAMNQWEVYRKTRHIQREDMHYDW